MEKEKQKTIDAIKKLYHIDEDCPVINSFGIYNDDVLNKCGILQYNRYAIITRTIGSFSTIIKREWCGPDSWNANILKKRFEECPANIWSTLLYHNRDYGYDGSKDPKNSVKIQGILFLELCQCEAIPYGILLKMAETLKTRRRAVYRLYRLLSYRAEKIRYERELKEREESIKQMLDMSEFGPGILSMPSIIDSTNK